MSNLLKENGHGILWLPPYSPDLNPIEHKWA
ncbi:transposase [uncultured Cardiobacterium sp.]